MSYNVRFTDRAKRDLKKLDKHVASLIIKWIRKNLEGCNDPRIHGKALIGDRGGQWRYRIGDYRLIADIDDDTITIFVINIGHRREIYSRY